MAKSTRIDAPAPQPDPPAADPTAVDEAGLLAASVARVEHRLALLDELADIAMEMARGVAEHSRAVKAAAAEAAKAGETPEAHDFGADDLAKLSRAVRLTLDLAGRLEETLRALRAGEAKIHEARRQERREREGRDLSASIERVEARKARVIEQVHMVIAREAESEGDSCDLLAALDERLNDDIDYINIDERPLREAVERICKDLDLKPDWSRWTDDGWPEDPLAVLGVRPPWSPFNRPSRTPLLYRNRDYERQEFDLIVRSP
ncbi:MAG TPA: hypothetical protein VKQ54_05635 [Caulobacteraceae bacterium]|nr:hypothetical protein [Caulobacteraceae bacterium]